ncbi:MAG: hypothetical protein C0433_10300 [Cyclobacterium sp.]|nr:hypothetical protein [Cyclobacterium sp.]
MVNTDQPISKREDDYFQRYPYAKRIAAVIQGHSSKDSFVVGIYGKWGEGKSSVLNFMKEELDKDSDIVIIDFNPWLFSDEKQLLMSFFGVLATGINVSLDKKKEKIGKKLLDYADAISSVGALAGFSGGKGIMEVFGKKLSNVSLDEYKSRINDSLEKAGKRVVVVMDDIDRLSISEIEVVFRLIKLVANFNNTVYLLSFDDELVASALDKSYSKGGYDYLEKIIQLPLGLPKAQISAVRDYTLTLILKQFEIHNIKLVDSEKDRFIRLFDQFFLKFILTPRVAVRISNTISFSIPLLNGEVNLVDLLFIEGVKVIYPQTYEFIKKNPSLFTSSYRSFGFQAKDGPQKKEDARLRIKDHLKLYSDQTQSQFIDFLTELFPQLKSVFGLYSVGDDSLNEWYSQKRICSARYFERYFTFVVLKGELPDVVFDEIIERLGSKDYLDNEEELQSLFSDLDGSEFALKIQFLENSFSTNQKEYLALNLALVASIFPEKDSAGSKIMAPFQQVAYFIQKCVEDQPIQSRGEFAAKLVDRAEPLNFAFEIWRVLHPKSDGGSKPDVLSKGAFSEISERLYQRCKAKFSWDQLYEVIEDSYFRYLLEIGSRIERNRIKEEMKLWLEEDNNNFLKLLYAFSQTTHSYSGGKYGGKTYKSNFSETFYRLLEKVVDINFFYSMSLELFGDQSDFKLTSDRDELSDEQLVGWFQRIHLEKAIGELNQDDINPDS